MCFQYVEPVIDIPPLVKTYRFQFHLTNNTLYSSIMAITYVKDVPNTS